MKCQQCGDENSDDRKFCGGCGTKLAVVCGDCGFANDKSASFCGGCGTRIAHPVSKPVAKTQPTMLGDRRNVTIFFADLSGYTALTESQDAEDTHYLVGLVFDVIDHAVADFGGTVHRHIGDEVMAVFGAPIAHRDDPLRAVQAALIIHKKINALAKDQKKALEVHIGIASGPVVIAGQGTANPSDVPGYAITGRAANLAARLNALATSGDTIISEAIFREVEPLVECLAMGEKQLKGLSDPIPIWNARHLRDKTQITEGRILVGRRAEMAQFVGIVNACIESQLGQVVVLRGEPGIGKTRLVEAFEEHTTKAGLSRHRCSNIDFGAGDGTDAIRMLTASILNISLSDETDAKQKAIDQVINDKIIIDEQCMFLNDLIGLSQTLTTQGVYEALDNEARISGRQKVLADLIQGVSKRTTLLLIIEDVHWADPSVLSDVACIAQAIQDCSVVLVLTSRIDGDPLDNNWRAEAGGCSLLSIDIGPLRTTEAMEMASLFEESDQSFVKTCITRASGNPLFLEQLLRSSKETMEGDVPATIQSLVLAQLDQLWSEDKQVLRGVSVLGQRFTHDALLAVCGRRSYSCDELIKKHLVRQIGEDYLFAHALIQESVYSSLLKEQRLGLHRRAADYFQNHDPLLYAGHLERAQDSAAPRAYLNAALIQASGYHFDQVLRLTGRGIELASIDADLFDLLILQADTMLGLGMVEESIMGFEEALKYAVSNKDMCKAQLGLAGGMRLADRYNDALHGLNIVEKTAIPDNMVEELASLNHMRGNLYWAMGRIDDCVIAHENSIRFARESGSLEAEVKALGGLADANYATGRMESAFDYFGRCVDAAEKSNLVGVAVSNRSMFAFSGIHLNRIHEALENSFLTIQAAIEIGQQRAEMLGNMSAVFALYELADYERARIHNARVLEIARKIGAPRFEAQALLYEGKIYRLTGEIHKSLTILQKALSISENVGHGFTGPRIASSLALVVDNPVNKRAMLQKSKDMLEMGSVSLNHFFAYDDAIEVCIQLRDQSGMSEYLQSYRTYTQVEPVPWSQFFMQRGQALLAFESGERSDDLYVRLTALEKQAMDAGLVRAAVELQKAISDIEI